MRPLVRFCLILVVAVGVVAIAPTVAGAAFPKWTDISGATGLGTAQAGLFRTADGKLHAVRLGPVRTIAAPPKTLQFFTLQAEGSVGPLDLLALVNPGSSVAYWHAQLLPPLSLSSSRTTVSHRKATTIKFTVTDVGDPVAGATVKLLGKSQTTNSKGVANISVHAGTAKGKHTATASRADYSSRTVRVKVT